MSARDHYCPVCAHDFCLCQAINKEQVLTEAKEMNPKDGVGTGKVPMSTVPAVVLAEIGLAMLEGARKYGRHNYRVAGIRASVYYDAMLNDKWSDDRPPSTRDLNWVQKLNETAKAMIEKHPDALPAYTKEGRS